MNGGGNELLTLQFGPFSNFTAAHFWNAQEVHMLSSLIYILSYILELL